MDKIIEKVRELCLRRVDYGKRSYKLDMAIETELKPLLLKFAKSGNSEVEE